MHSEPTKNVLLTDWCYQLPSAWDVCQIGATTVLSPSLNGEKISSASIVTLPCWTRSGAPECSTTWSGRELWQLLSFSVQRLGGGGSQRWMWCKERWWPPVVKMVASNFSRRFSTATRWSSYRFQKKIRHPTDIWVGLDQAESLSGMLCPWISRLGPQIVCFLAGETSWQVKFCILRSVNGPFLDWDFFGERAIWVSIDTAMFIHRSISLTFIWISSWKLSHHWPVLLGKSWISNMVTFHCDKFSGLEVVSLAFGGERIHIRNHAIFGMWKYLKLPLMPLGFCMSTFVSWFFSEIWPLFWTAWLVEAPMHQGRSQRGGAAAPFKGVDLEKGMCHF